MSLNLDLNNLDPKNVGAWPIAAKAGLVAIVCVAVLGAGYYFDTMDQEAVLETKRAEEQKLRTDFEGKQAKAASLDAYREQMKEMQESFGTMLRQLPNKNEVPDLLVDVTQTGLASGLEFDLFQPKPETPREFFSEMPILLKVTGTYHELGEFASGIAALPRIVTLHEITISAAKGGGKKGAAADKLQMQATAKTYRYLDDEEIAAAEAAARAKSKGKKGGK